MKGLRHAVALAGLVFALAVVMDFYKRLPDQIATHFNGAGVANGFGARSTLWVLLGIAYLLYATLVAIGSLPWIMNLKRPLAPEKEKIVWAETTAMVGWLNVEVCWMFAYICLAMVRNGLGLQVGLGAWFLPMTLLVVFGTCVFYSARIFGAMRGSEIGD
ncbi:MAG TPA: DUF1648 domain-containing protein [Edaphobacter sp.]|jgi:uncharacterized membrane protein|nr:DUF1648 domain-containing protein [Edaphobacter sp.]